VRRKGFIAALLALCTMPAVAADIFINADITTSQTWTANNEYILTDRIYVVNGASMTRFRAFLQDRPPGAAAYDIYPQGLTEPYRSSRFKIGEDMYATLGIAREDKPARFAQFAKNLEFFGAPAALFCFVDRQMGPPQWSDLGMFLQTFMLLAQEAGLDTCPQEAWAVHEAAVSEFVGAPEEQRIFCGVAIGHADRDNPINSLVSDREPLEVFARFV